jgi:hypothetical protein
MITALPYAIVALAVGLLLLAAFAPLPRRFVLPRKLPDLPEGFGRE